MKETLEVYIKSVYGVDKVYPHCNEANMLANLAGTTTLTFDTIYLAKRLGFKFKVVGYSGLMFKEGEEVPELGLSSEIEQYSKEEL